MNAPNAPNAPINIANKEPTKKDEDPIQIHPLKIVLQTNIKGKEMLEVVFGMFTNEKYPDNPEYKYPFFTDNVKYPTSIAQNKETALEFFFNRKTFEKTLRDNMINYVDSNLLLENVLLDQATSNLSGLHSKISENGEHNMMMMLRCLFKISDTFGKVLSSSFRQQIKDEFNQEIFSFDIRSLFMGNQDESTIKMSGKEYLIGDVIWLNDIANHPIYRTFLQGYNEKIKERTSYATKVKNNYYQKIKKILIELNKYTTVIGSLSKLTKFTDQLDKQSVRDNKQELKNIRNNNIFKVKAKDITDTNPSILLKDRFNSDGTFIPFKREDDINEIIPKLNEIMDAFIGVHSFIRSYNSNSKHSYDNINIQSDIWRDFTNIYLAMISIKAAKIVLDFIEGHIQKFDLNEKYNDGSPKQEKELDVIKEIKEKYSKYVEMSGSIKTSIQQITDPTRISTNPQLEKLITKLKEPTIIESTEKDRFRDIYLKIFENVDGKQLYPEIMYTGVNLISTNKNAMNEVYVYINLVDKKKFLQTKLKCKLKNEMAANDLLNIMNRKHAYLVNPYRLYGDFEAASQPNLPVKSNTKYIDKNNKKTQVAGGIYIHRTKKIRRRTIK